MNTKLRFLALTAVGSMTAFAALLVACGDDDDGIDVPSIDSGTPDRNVADTGSDEDADADAGNVAVPDAAAINTFRGQLETALCGSLARCCFGSSNFPDGGAVDAAVYDDGAYYNAGKCSALTRPLGFEGSTAGLDVADAGSVGINAAKAVDCISKLNALSCSLTGAELKAARAACYEAVVGLGAPGTPCTTQIECENGSFCANPDGGAGVCTKVVGAGGACNVFPYTGTSPTSVDDPAYGAQQANAQANEVACSTRAGGDTGLHCNSYDPSLITAENLNGYRPQGEWRCVAGIANNDDGAGCNSTVWCADGLCNSQPAPGETGGEFVCRSPLDYFGSYQYCRNVVDNTTTH